MPPELGPGDLLAIHAAQSTTARDLEVNKLLSTKHPTNS
jgi:hypothetical protein